MSADVCGDDATRAANSDFTITFKWQGTEIMLDNLDPTCTVLDMKLELQSRTRVAPGNQKIMGLKTKSGGKVDDTTVIGDLNVKKSVKYMMMGSPDEEIARANEVPEDVGDIVDDFDIPVMEDLPTNQREEFLAKIDRRVKEYKITEINPVDDTKKLLVLDIDYTLFDHKSVGETGLDLMRPYLHDFLSAAFVNYNIVIWSATGMKWIQAKMRELGVEKNPNYKIMCYLDSLAMITVLTKTYGMIETKPLGVLWGKYPQFSSANSLLIDDLRRNFLMNPKNGLKIRPFRDAHRNRETDRELYDLIPFLQFLSKQDDFTKVDFTHWEQYT